jgi:hypothetical protein
MHPERYGTAPFLGATMASMDSLEIRDGTPEQKPRPTPAQILSDADRAALRKFYQIEIEGHCAGCMLRELGEDMRDIAAQISGHEQRIATITERTRHQRPEAGWTDAERRAIEGLRIRLAVIQPEHARIEDRARTLWRTRDGLAKVLTETGLLRRSEVSYG